MPAAISAPNRAKVMELYQDRKTLTQIGVALSLARNTVAKIVREEETKDAAAAQASADAALSPAQLFKLRYLLDERMGISECPKCNSDFAYMATDNTAKCGGCGMVWELVEKKGSPSPRR